MELKIIILSPESLEAIFSEWGSGLDTAGASESEFFEDWEDSLERIIAAGSAEEIEQECYVALEDTKRYLHPDDYGVFIRECVEEGAIRLEGETPPPFRRELPECWAFDWPLGTARSYTAVVTPAALLIRRTGDDLYHWTAADYSGKFKPISGEAPTAKAAARAVCKAAENWFTDLARIEKLRALIPDLTEWCVFCVHYHKPGEHMDGRE